MVSGYPYSYKPSMVRYGMRIVSPISSVALWQIGAAVAQVGEDDTVFYGGAVGFTFNSEATFMHGSVTTGGGSVRPSRR